MNFLFIAVAFLIFSQQARGEEIPFVLEGGREIKFIPDNQGVSFFYGSWSGTSRSSGYLDMKITPTKMEWQEAKDIKDYRVLVEAPNYVLLLSQNQVREPEVSNWFTILTIGNRWKEDVNSKTAYPYMGYYSCGHFIEYNKPDIFHFSKKRILAIFKNSVCMSNIAPSKVIESIDRIEKAGSFWSFMNYRYSRDNPPKLP